MADTKLSALTALTAIPADTDEIYINDGGTSKKITYRNLFQAGVGVGLARTDGTLHVHTATAGSVTANTVADDLVVENSTSGGIAILTPDASPSTIRFGSPTVQDGAIINWRHSTNLFHVGTNNASATTEIRSGADTVAITVDGNQDVLIGTAVASARLSVLDTVAPVVDIKSSLVSTGVGPEVILERLNTSSANNDIIGAINFVGNAQPADIPRDFAVIRSVILDVTDSTKDGELQILTPVAASGDTVAIRVAIAAGLYTGGATGGDQGADTINASSYYVDGTVGADFGPAGVASITVVKGIVTAIS